MKAAPRVDGHKWTQAPERGSSAETHARAAEHLGTGVQRTKPHPCRSHPPAERSHFLCFRKQAARSGIGRACAPASPQCISAVSISKYRLNVFLHINCGDSWSCG